MCKACATCEVILTVVLNGSYIPLRIWSTVLHVGGPPAHWTSHRRDFGVLLGTIYRYDNRDLSHVVWKSLAQARAGLYAKCANPTTRPHRCKDYPPPPSSESSRRRSLERSPAPSPP